MRKIYSATKNLNKSKNKIDRLFNLILQNVIIDKLKQRVVKTMNLTDHLFNLKMSKKTN